MIRDHFGYVSFESLREKFSAAGYHTNRDSANNAFVAFNESKVIVSLIAGAYNVRNAKQATEYACKLAHDIAPSAAISENNILVIVYDDMHGNHYFSKNVIYFNERLGGVTMPALLHGFRNELEIIKDAGKHKKAARNSYRYAHPESIHYFAFAMIITLIATAATFIFTMDSSIWGYSAEKVFAGESYRLITYMFAHSGVRHLIGNMISLVIIGSVINKYEGNIHFLIIYFGGGILSALMSSIYALVTGTDVAIITVGASGAIFALLGALLVESFNNYDLESNKGNIILYILIVMVSSNLGGNISIRTHIFGFIAGMFLGYICFKENQKRYMKQASKYGDKEAYYEKKYGGNNGYTGPTSISRV